MKGRVRFLIMMSAAVMLTAVSRSSAQDPVSEMPGAPGAPLAVGDALVAAGQQASGPRTSPFEPPEENDRSFVTDAAPKLDTGCIFSSLGPIVFDIEIDRHVGELNPDGTLKHAAALVAAGLLSEKANLIMPAFDVDSEATPPPPFLPEQDRVLFNGEEIGFLSGTNNTWKLNSFQIDIAKVKFAARGAIGNRPAAAKNTVAIEIDVGNFPTQVWCTSIDWGAGDFKAMSPILLVHGNNSDGGFFQRQGFTQALESRNLLFDNSINMATSPIAANGATLDGLIPNLVASFGVDSVHLVAHSKGGLDSREYLASFQPRHDDDFKVLSYSTLSTPHDGSVGADLLIQRDRALQQTTELDFNGFPAFTATVANRLPGADAGTPDLTTWSTSAFNAANLPRVSGDIIFNTVAADADQNGNERIDDNPDEYLELRQESADLQNLHNQSQLLARTGVNVAYQILRRVAGVNLMFEQRRRFGVGPRRTVAVLTAVPNPQELGNDVLVTIPSGQGTASVAGRTANTRVFQGAQGRNHSSVANEGVGDVVAGWIIQAERQEGDLR